MSIPFVPPYLTQQIYKMRQENLSSHISFDQGYRQYDTVEFQNGSLIAYLVQRPNVGSPQED